MVNSNEDDIFSSARATHLRFSTDVACRILAPMLIKKTSKRKLEVRHVSCNKIDFGQGLAGNCA